MSSFPQHVVSKTISSFPQNSANFLLNIHCFPSAFGSKKGRKVFLTNKLILKYGHLCGGESSLDLYTSCFCDAVHLFLTLYVDGKMDAKKNWAKFND